MKSLRQLCAASVLILTLTFPASAGWISTGAAPPDPSPTPTAATTEGWISTPITGQAGNGSGEGAVGGSAAEAALSLIQGLLSLF
jgi:hypothetical protein